MISICESEAGGPVELLLKRGTRGEIKSPLTEITVAGPCLRASTPEVTLHRGAGT